MGRPKGSKNKPKKEEIPQVNCTGEESAYELLELIRLQLRSLGIYNTWRHAIPIICHGEYNFNDAARHLAEQNIITLVIQ